MRTFFVSAVILFILSSGYAKADVVGKGDEGNAFQQQQTLIMALPCTTPCTSANSDTKAPDVATSSDNTRDDKSHKTITPTPQVLLILSSQPTPDEIPPASPGSSHVRHPEAIKTAGVLLEVGDTPTCDPDGQKTLTLVPEHQQPDGSQWCWAATAQMVMQYHGVTSRQCQLVTDAKDSDLQDANVDTCCSGNLANEGPRTDSTGAHSLCANLTGWPEDVFTTTSPRFTWVRTLSPPTISWTDLVNEICFGRPFIYAVEWLDEDGNPDDSFHVRVVKGYHVLTSTLKPGTKDKYVEQWDPLHTYNDVPFPPLYSEFVADQYSVHARDYIHILKLTP
jgi:hypothetical protein